MSKEENKSPFAALLEALRDATEQKAKEKKANKVTGLGVGEILDLIKDDKSTLTAGVVRDACRGIGSSIMRDCSSRELLEDPHHVSGILIGMAMVLESKAANISADAVISKGDDTVKSMLQLSTKTLSESADPSEVVGIVLSSLTDLLKAAQKKAS